VTRAFAGDVASVCLPLSACSILRVYHPHGTPLIVRTRRHRAPGPRLAALGAQLSGIAKNEEVSGAPSSGRTASLTARPPRMEPELLPFPIIHDVAPGGR
jgi:hypothetical protein